MAFLIILLVLGGMLAYYKARQDKAVRDTGKNARQEMKARRQAAKSRKPEGKTK